MAIDLSEQELLARMKTFEDHFVERKTAADSKDWLKTVVGFANSAPDGYPCVLFIGVRNDSAIESPQVDLDSLQRTLNRELKKIYPTPAYLPKIIRENDLQALSVIVFGSELRPHFAGPSYVRKGSETLPASEEEFAELISRRNSKANMILQSKGKAVTVVNRQEAAGRAAMETGWSQRTVVVACNQFWVTLETSGVDRISFPLKRVELSFDDAQNRLRLEINR
jgi:predicted HTH transcriptional regulator